MPVTKDKPTLADAFRVRHSPGPWTTVHWHVRDAFDTTVADCMNNGSTAQWKANAALIAAAPELLWALNDLIDRVDRTALADGTSIDTSRAHGLINSITNQGEPA